LRIKTPQPAVKKLSTPIAATDAVAASPLVAVPRSPSSLVLVALPVEGGGEEWRSILFIDLLVL